ncbi:hypothetical protein BWZ22_06100 [Seonamhaeicola sp. S2-3]|uniref:hypothetical protein n=1 Tax=Seonamhaeicola sp. S2-3 TaxID=1936081 RepID=UPI0009729E7A|nr:hypothetical protein [Seonamhaeicola sp. S2-3]APY10835.1 hypothetical protein BWZ22_06100 [Seonamhaeicola sp. S2-3]
MKKILYFLLLCSLFGYSASNNTLEDVTTKTTTKENVWKIYNPDTFYFSPKSTESILFNLTDVRFNSNNVTPNDTLFNFKKHFETLISESYKVKFKTQNIIFVPFNNTDIIFPFHTHW